MENATFNMRAFFMNSIQINRFAILSTKRQREIDCMSIVTKSSEPNNPVMDCPEHQVSPTSHGVSYYCGRAVDAISGLAVGTLIGCAEVCATTYGVCRKVLVPITDPEDINRYMFIGPPYGTLIAPAHPQLCQALVANSSIALGTIATTAVAGATICVMKRPSVCTKLAVSAIAAVTIAGSVFLAQASKEAVEAYFS